LKTPPQNYHAHVNVEILNNSTTIVQDNSLLQNSTDYINTSVPNTMIKPSNIKKPESFENSRR
jgi:hypothetical protein